MVTLNLSRLMQARIWRLQHASSVFATDSAWQWFKRINRDRLVSSGALIARRGRAGDLVDVEVINTQVAAILMDAVSSSLKLGDVGSVKSDELQDIDDEDAIEVASGSSDVLA